MSRDSNPYRPIEPNQILEMLRDAVEKVAEQRRRGYRAADVDQVIDLVADLDEHLSQGGQLPDDWDHSDIDPPDDEDDEEEEDYEPVPDDEIG